MIAPQDPGQNLSLADNAAHQFASAKAMKGVFVGAPLSNTAAVYVGFTNAVTSGATGKGLELQPGDRVFFEVPNANCVWAITATATQNVHALAL